NRTDQRVLGGQAGAEGESVVAELGASKLCLQRVAGRVGAAAVLVAVSQAADAVLGVGRGEVQRWNYSTGDRLEFLARMDKAGVCCLMVFSQRYQSLEVLSLAGGVGQWISCGSCGDHFAALGQQDR